MFDLEALAAVDPHVDEAALIEQITLELVKSAAAAGQARAAALDEKSAQGTGSWWSTRVRPPMIWCAT